MRRSISPSLVSSFPFFSNAPATPAIYTLSLHDALPIEPPQGPQHGLDGATADQVVHPTQGRQDALHGALPLPAVRSEEHTAELQSRQYLVCRRPLEKKK